MTGRPTIESLETRSLLSTYSPANPPPVPEPGTVTGIGTTDPALVGVDAGYAARNHVSVLVSDDNVSIFHGGREGNFTAPQVREDGAVTLVGNADADRITVERVRGLSEWDKNTTSTTLRYVNFINDADGSRQEAGGGISPTSMAEALTRFQGELAELQARLAAATDPNSSGNATLREQIAETQKNVDYFQDMYDRAVDGDFIRYTLDGVYDFFVQIDLATAGSPRINIDAGAGNDIVQISQNVPLRANVYGGSGSDTITGGKKPANLAGGGGNDRLVSRSLSGATLDGGKGSDNYFNRAIGADVAAARVLGRNDGDQLILPASIVPIRSPGYFALQSVQLGASIEPYLGAFIAIPLEAGGDKNDPPAPTIQSLGSSGGVGYYFIEDALL